MDARDGRLHRHRRTLDSQVPKNNERPQGVSTSPHHTSSPGFRVHRLAPIYASLGIPAHETMLGYFQGKIVCACKDFCYPDKELHEFRELKNSTPDDSTGFSGTPSDGEAIFLSDVLASIEIVGVLRSTPGVLDRFWDMFVVDAFIKNPDRNKVGDFKLRKNLQDCGNRLISGRMERHDNSARSELRGCERT